MTDDQIQSVKDDIAFMRALAAEGQKTPMLGGAIMVAAGLIFGLASIAHWALVVGILRLDPAWGEAAVWLPAGVLFAIALTVVIRRTERKPGARSPTNTATGAAWMGVGIAIFVMFLSYAAAAWQLRSEAVLATFPSVIFALYGAGWAVASAMTGKRWLWFVALGSWAMAPLLGWLSGQSWMYLVYGGALILLMSVPGLVLMRAEPSETV